MSKLKEFNRLQTSYLKQPVFLRLALGFAIGTGLVALVLNEKDQALLVLASVLFLMYLYFVLFNFQELINSLPTINRILFGVLISLFSAYLGTAILLFSVTGGLLFKEVLTVGFFYEWLVGAFLGFVASFRWLKTEPNNTFSHQSLALKFVFVIAGPPISCMLILILAGLFNSQ